MPARSISAPARWPPETCTAPNETRLIDGVPVTRACWETTKTYQCQTVVGGGNDCGKLDATPGCAFDHETCLDDPPSGDGSCKVAERVYKCPIPGSTTQPAQYICGDDVYCVNGDCEPIVREASDEFKDAVVALDALGQANSEFDESTLTLFKGTAESCAHKVFGLANCCSGGRAAPRTAAVQPVGGPARPEGRCRALPQDRHLLLVELPRHLPHQARRLLLLPVEDQPDPPGAGPPAARQVIGNTQEACLRRLHRSSSSSSSTSR